MDPTAERLQSLLGERRFSDYKRKLSVYLECSSLGESIRLCAILQNSLKTREERAAHDAFICALSRRASAIQTRRTEELEQRIETKVGLPEWEKRLPFRRNRFTNGIPLDQALYDACHRMDVVGPFEDGDREQLLKVVINGFLAKSTVDRPK